MKQLFAFVVMLLSASMLNAQDIITLRSGETINGKISEVSTTEIRYYKVDNTDGAVYVTNKSDVVQIVYANGAKDVFNTQPSQPVVQSRVKYFDLADKEQAKEWILNAAEDTAPLNKNE